MSHSAQQQLTQNEPLAIKFSTEHKVPIGSKWANNNNQQRNRGEYQNICNPSNTGWFNNQIQNLTTFQYSNRKNHSLNQGYFNGQYRSNNIYTPQRGCSMNSGMLRGMYNNINDCRHPYRGSYQYRYPQYRSRNMTQFQGSMYRWGPNRGQQRLQNHYNYEANVRPQHFNDYMRQKEEYNEKYDEKYDDTMEYKGKYHKWIFNVHNVYNMAIIPINLKMIGHRL